MRNRWFLAIFLVVVCNDPLQAQNHYNISQFTHETGDFFTQPGRWQGKDWLRFGSIVAGSVAAMQVDEPIRRAVLRDNRRYFRSVPMEAGRIWGEWYTPPIIASAFGMHGWLAHNTSSSKIGFEILQAVIYSESITQTLKAILGRARPYENEGAFSYHPFTLSGMGFHSLPGGHNTEGWAMSAILSRNAHSKTLKILAFVPSVLTLVSRVYQDQHWTSDDLAGAAIGFVVGNWVVSHHERRDALVNEAPQTPLAISIRF